MKIFILAVGNKMPDWVVAGFTEYAKRMPYELPVKLIDIKPEKRGTGKNTEQILSIEGGRISAALPSGCRTIVLDERGQQWSTVKFTNVLTEWMEEGRDIAFIIGGADGLHHNFKKNANEVLALSTMTLPHALVRVMLIEQLYRAASIIKRHPYHRA